jgi:hypothetical protein
VPCIVRQRRPGVDKRIAARAAQLGGALAELHQPRQRLFLLEQHGRELREHMLRDSYGAPRLSVTAR